MGLSPLWLAGVEANFPCLSSAEWGQLSIQLYLFSRITSFPDSKLIHHWGVLVTEHCVPFSADQWASEGKARKMEAIVWDCQSCCKCDPFKAKHLKPSVVLWDIVPLPTRIFGPNPTITFLREKMGEETVRDWGSFAGINSNSSKLKLRNVTYKPELYRKMHGTSKNFLFLLLMLRFCPWGIYF